MSGHRKVVHESMDFHCDQRDYRATHQVKLKLHKVIKHEEEIEELTLFDENTATVMSTTTPSQAASSSTAYSAAPAAGDQSTTQRLDTQSTIFVLFNLEETGGNIHRDSIIEVGTSVYSPIRKPLHLDTPLEFSTLVNTSAKIKAIHYVVSSNWLDFSDK